MRNITRGNCISLHKRWWPTMAYEMFSWLSKCCVGYTGVYQATQRNLEETHISEKEALIKPLVLETFYFPYIISQKLCFGVTGAWFTLFAEKKEKKLDNKYETIVFKTVHIRQQRTVNLEWGKPQLSPLGCEGETQTEQGGLLELSRWSWETQESRWMGFHGTEC